MVIYLWCLMEFFVLQGYDCGGSTGCVCGNDVRGFSRQAAAQIPFIPSLYQKQGNWSQRRYTTKRQLT